MLNANTKARIALFNRAAKADDAPDVVYPVMTGTLENSDGALSIRAYRKMSKEGKEFLSLLIKNDGDERTFSGSLFRDTKPGKEGHYYGYISEQFVEEKKGGEKVYTNSEWQLGISAKKQTADSGKKYIGGDVYVMNKRGTSSATSAAEEDLAF